MKEWIISQDTWIPSKIFLNTLILFAIVRYPVLKKLSSPIFLVCLLFRGKQWHFITFILVCVETGRDLSWGRPILLVWLLRIFSPVPPNQYYPPLFHNILVNAELSLDSELLALSSLNYW